jgi:hypothetical protein
MGDMTATWRHWLRYLLLLAAAQFAVGGGCNILAWPYFLFGPQDKIDPQLKKLAFDDKDKEAKVAILVHSDLELRPEMLDANRQLAEFVRSALNEACKANGEKVKIISPTKVENYLKNHPDWETMDRTELGEKLGADRVIFLEVTHLSLYQPGSANMIYRGEAHITVELIDVPGDDNDEPTKKEFTCTYPTDSKGGLALVEADRPVQAFKAEFFKYIAKQIAWHFTAHPTEDSYQCE